MHSSIITIIYKNELLSLQIQKTTINLQIDKKDYKTHRESIIALLVKISVSYCSELVVN